MATVYFIDFANGNDANNGTSKSTPWKKCPGMNDSGGIAHASGHGTVYTHAAGDQFIFKGGTTWPAVCFPMTISAGGSSSATVDYYGTDATWPSSGWTRAVFDFENSFTSAGYGVGIQASNVTFGDGMDLKRLKSPTYFGSGGTITSNGSFTGIRITNAIIRDWCLATPIADNTGGSGGGVISYGAVIKIDHCELHQQNSATISGVVAYNVNDVSFCEIHHAAEALHGGGSYHDNHIHDLLTPTNPNGEHTAAIVTYVPSTIYNNHIHDLSGNAAPVELWGATSSTVSNSTDVLYNNVIYRAGVQPCIWIGNDSTLYNTHTVKLYNNTLDAGSGFCFSNRASTNAALGTLDARNNHFITSGTAININNPSQLGGPVTNLTAPTQPTSGGNLIQTPTQATSAGYVSTNFYQPPNGSGATINVGADLSSVFTTDRLGISRPQGGIWDVGAYEFSGVSNQPPNGTITLPTQNVTITQGSTVNFTATASDPDNNLPLSYAWDFGSSNIGTSNVQNPGAKTFSNIGVFTVTLTVRDSLGLADPTPDTRTITVNAPPNNPTLSVTPSYNFGFVDINTPSNGVLVVTNTGTGTLTGAASASLPFSITSGGSYSLAANQSQNVFIRYQQSIAGSIDSSVIAFTGAAGATPNVTGRTPFDLTFNANQGVISAPFAIQSDLSVAQSSDASADPSTGGLAYFEFVAPSAGDYTISSSVSAPATFSNSFFINVDAEPTISMIWDINPITNGFETRTVVWRGNGSSDGPAQFDPKTFTLSQGKHKLYLRGREASTKIASITIFSKTAHVNQAPTATLTSDVNAGVGPLLVTFTLTCADVDGTVASGVLDYGDGTSTLTISSPASSSTRTHTYSGVGSVTTYAATWTVTDDSAATGAATRNITLSPTPPPPPNQPPSATISASPLSGNSSLPVTFTLGASDPDDSVASAVIDYGDGVSETITNPASSLSRSHTYSNAGPGDINRTATYTATDTHSATGAASAIIAISPPIAAAISVLSTSLSFGSISLTTTRDLPLVVKNVGGQTLTGVLSTSAPFSITTSPATYSLAPGTSSTFNIRFAPSVYSTTSNGTLTLTGGGGASVSLSGTSLANVAPIVSLDPSLNGKTLTAPATVQLTATASDSDGTVTKVELFNGVSLFGTQVTAPYTFQGVLSAASYSFTAKATDSGGATTTTSPAVVLTVQNPVFPPPTVSITSPAQGSVFNSGVPIQIQVTSSAVVSVDYLADGAHIGQDTQAPHNFTWTNASVGAHTLTVMVTDNHANHTTSNPVGIVVLANPPQTEPIPFIIYVNPS